MYDEKMLRCKFCGSEMAYIHGHAACVNSFCSYYGCNQAECCDGETASNSAAPTSVVAALRKFVPKIKFRG